MTKTIVKISNNVYNKVYLPYLKCNKRTQIYFGGASSGKSVFLAERVVEDMLNGGRNYLICRAVQRTIRRSVFNEITKIITDWDLNNLFETNKTEMVITCANGYQIMFAGLDDVEKLKSITPQKGVITDIWVEEATETDLKSIKQLYKRQRGGDEIPKRITLSFNPILKSHWIYSEYFAGWMDYQNKLETDDLLILKTTYKDNEFLTDEDKRDLENETDEYFYNVYTLGNWGVLGDVIFTNWEVKDLSEIKSVTERFNNGLDFGFSSDPAAIANTARNKAKREIYIFDELYERGLTNDILAKEALKIIGNDYIVCDSAEPKSIAELSQNGVLALPAEKGPDTILHGIQWLQQHKIYVDPKCTNMILELQQYQWKKDKNGNGLHIPIGPDHLIDALRYAYSYEWKEEAYGYGENPLMGYRG